MITDLKINQSLDLKGHRIVSQKDWEIAQKQHLKDEKELTRFYDKVVASRRQLPWFKIEKEYVFDGPEGKLTFADLFQGRSQLVVQHFMFGPDDKEGCVGCSFTADHVDCARIHFEQNDLSFVAISRGPISKLLQYRKRMGWSFNWVSSLHNSFNYDFHVSYKKEDLEKGEVYHNFKMQRLGGEEQPGTSVFFKSENGDIFCVSSTYARGGELLIGAYNYLDLTPKGRNEDGPNGNLMDWVRRHDTYAQAEAAHCCAPAEPKS